MSMMAYCVLDANRALHSCRHGSFVDQLIPALSDDPETIDELAYAMRRFRRDEDEEPLVDWKDGVLDEPYDAGLCLIDLPGRLVVFESTYSHFERAGQVVLKPNDGNKHVDPLWISYHLSHEWRVISPLESWESWSRELRAQRFSKPPFDARPVLYGQVAEFIVNECWAARGGTVDAAGHWTPPEDWHWLQLPARADRAPAVKVDDAVAEIHARWLMTVRPDLHDQSPRQVLLAQHEHLTWQLQDREFQWSTFRRRPQTLPRQSFAYRHAGFGTHEIVLYYHLLRHLIRACWEMVVHPRSDQSMPSREQTIERLSALTQEWLHRPDHERLFGKTPAWVIECERLRLPFILGAQDSVLDDDCPDCQTLSDFGPMFWHLDDTDMDEDFPFALALQSSDHTPPDTRDDGGTVDDGNLPWNEQQWEQCLKRSDARAAKLGELLETLQDHPNRDQLIAREMGWDLYHEPDRSTQEWRGQVHPEFEHNTSFEDECEYEEDGEPGGGWLVDDEAEDEFDRARESLEAIPAYREGRQWGLEVYGRLRPLVERAEESEVDPESPVHRAVAASQQAPAKIAGGHAMGYHDEVICGNIVCCKRALQEVDDALDGLQEIRELQLLDPSDIEALLEQGRRVRQLLVEHIDALRARVWWS